MAEAGEAMLEEGPPRLSIAGQSMDLDLDLDASWSFDLAAFLSDSPLENFPLSSSTPAPPAPSSLQLSSSTSPQSASVLFEENVTDLPAEALDIPNSVPGTCDTADDSRPSIRLKSRPISNATKHEIYDVSCAIKGKMTRALRCFKETTDQHVLVQVWAPVNNGDRQVLTTSEQPFVLDPRCSSLLQYRTVSLTYLFSIDSHSDGNLGLPGRVFCQQFPEWTPDVQYYSSKEYPRLTHALNYNVKGSLALPVFEPLYERCVGVVELIMTSPKINYACEVDKVCKALEVVNLKSTGIMGHPKNQIANENHQIAMSEILEILTIVCEMHKLPLGQTWVPRLQEKLCLSTTNAAFYIIEPHMWGFRDACQEHRLYEDQGVAGMAYLRQSPCFSSNITRFDKNSYPLVHYARMFELAGCFAVCLQNCHNGKDDYVVEFFLPTDCRSEVEQLTFLTAILTSVKKLTRSLKIVSEGEILRVDGDSDAPKIPLVLVQKSTNEKGIVEKSQSQNLTTTDLRKRGKVEKVISLEVLRTYFSGSLKEASKSLGVCPTTMKRICRQHGISRWPSRKIKKVNRSLSKLKIVMESVQGAEGAFDLLPSLTGSWPETGKPIGLEGENNGPGINLNASKTSRPSNSPDSQGSCPGVNLGRPIKEPSTPDGPPIEESVSSKDLKSMCLSINGGKVDATVNASLSTVKIKASYRGEIIRFSIESTASLFLLKEQVAKRLNLNLGEFDLKYLDDDGKWVSLSCDVDLEDCLEFSGGHVVRMSVVDFSGAHEREFAELPKLKKLPNGTGS